MSFNEYFVWSDSPDFWFCTFYLIQKNMVSESGSRDCVCFMSNQNCQYTAASVPIVAGSVFMQRFRLFLVL